MEGVASLLSFILIESVAHGLWHILELRENTAIEVLSIVVLSLLHEFAANFSYSFEILHNALERVWISADWVPSDLADGELYEDIIANFVLLFLRFVDEMYAFMVRHLVVAGREPDVCNLTSLHCAHDNLVVLMETWIFHFEALVDAASLRVVNKLTVIMACFMLIVDIVSVSDESTSTAD